jgi:hypothetical protein
LALKLNYDDIIKLEKFSNFKIYQIPDNVDCRFEVALDTGYTLNRG